MSIGLPDEFDALLTRLGLGAVALPDLNARDLARQVWSFARHIWENIDHIHYTDHATGHSLRIIEFFRRMDAMYHWDEFEKLVFIIAALIHDIGMQYRVWPLSGEQVRALELPELSLCDHESVRAAHSDLGMTLIDGLVNRKITLAWDGISWGHHERDVIWRAATVAFAHSSEVQLARMVEGAENYGIRDDFYGGKYRPRLLASTLRLSDELDGTARRISHPEHLWSRQVPQGSRIHWISCLLVESTSLSVTRSGPSVSEATDFPPTATIKLTWQVPMSLDPAQRNDVRAFLEQTRIARIKKTIVDNKQFLTACREPYLGEFEVQPLANQAVDIPADQGFVDALQDILSDYRSHLSPRRPPRPAESAIESASGEQNDSLRHVLSAVTSEATSLEARLDEWFTHNAERGGMHWRLGKQHQEHTDTYLNCRSLVSDVDLLRAIADKIAQSYIECRIQTVVSVGTSAIPLGVMVAYRLGADVTFTVSPRAAPEQRKNEYSSVEVIPAVGTGQNVLIIDDVVAKGEVAKEVVDRIRVCASGELGSVYHHSIFRLGDSPIEPIMLSAGVTSFGSIVTIPDVAYYPDDPRLCPLCMSGLALMDELTQEYIDVNAPEGDAHPPTASDEPHC